MTWLHCLRWCVLIRVVVNLNTSCVFVLSLSVIDRIWHAMAWVSQSFGVLPCTCNDAAVSSSHGLSMGVTTWPSYALSRI